MGWWFFSSACSGEWVHHNGWMVWELGQGGCIGIERLSCWRGENTNAPYPNSACFISVLSSRNSFCESMSKSKFAIDCSSTLTVCRLSWISMTLVLQHLAINDFSRAKVGETLLWCCDDRSISITVPKVTRLVQPASSLWQDISSVLYEEVHGIDHVCVCAYEGKTLICCRLTLCIEIVSPCLVSTSLFVVSPHCRTIRGQCLQNGQWKHFKPIQVLTPFQLRQMFLDRTAVFLSRPQRFSSAKPANLKKLRSCSEAR